jgi:23S rRNA (guanosine2251-2'-O)-methyltransferase
MAPAGIGAEVEGFHAVAAAVAAGRVVALTVEEQRLRHDAYGSVVADAEAAGAVVDIVDDVRPLAVTPTPQGVVARCRPLRTVSLEAAVRVHDPAALLVFDHLEDPRNLGAAVRSAVAAGVRVIVVPTRRSAPVGATAFKAAAGAFERVALVTVSSIPDALRRMEKLAVWRVGLDGSGDRSLFGLELLTEPVALVVGAEGSGLSRLSRERCDVVAAIPHRGPVDSLNASVAASLAVFEVARMRGWVT